jgi:hypothetical protein
MTPVCWKGDIDSCGGGASRGRHDPSPLTGALNPLRLESPPAHVRHRQQGTGDLRPSQPDPPSTGWPPEAQGTPVAPHAERVPGAFQTWIELS